MKTSVEMRDIHITSSSIMTVRKYTSQSQDLSKSRKVRAQLKKNTLFSNEEKMNISPLKEILDKSESWRKHRCKFHAV